MAIFVSKTWLDALFHYPTRYKIHHADLSVEQVTMENDFEDSGDQPIQTGDVFDAYTMNQLEQRIANGFSTCIETLSGTSAPTASQGKDGDTYFQYEVIGQSTEIVAMFVKVSGSWLEVDIGGGGGDASVYIGTTPPDASVGSNGNLYVQYHLENNVPVVDAFFVKIAGAWASISTGGGGDSYLELTQAEYDALTPAEKNNGTIYFITDTNGDGEDFQPVIYSLEEREIGVWTDGKPLYEKTIVETLDTSPSTVVNLASMNVDTIVSISGMLVNTQAQFGYKMLLSGIVNDGNSSGIYVTREGDMKVYYAGNYQSVTVTIRYTKTTDTAGSGTWTPQGVPALHYSADEHVVGTWIDGSTLYEKTFYMALPTSGGIQNVSFAHGISNLNIIVERSISNFIRTGESVGTDGTSQYYTSIQSIDGTNITYKTTVDGAGRYVIITIRYTKTS